MKNIFRKLNNRKTKNHRHNTDNCISDTITVAIDKTKIDCKYLENGLRNPDYYVYAAMIIAFETGGENRQLRTLEEYKHFSETADRIIELHSLATKKMLQFLER